MINRIVEVFIAELCDEDITIYVVEDGDITGEDSIYLVTDNGATLHIASECLIDDESMDAFIAYISSHGIEINNDGELVYTNVDVKEAIRVASLLADYIRSEL